MFPSACTFIVFWSSLSFTEQTNNKERESRQTHTQRNNKNKEGKQHRNKTEMENMQSVTTWKKKAANQKSSKAESFKHVKRNI
jgi:hypothetical protein